MHSKKVVIAIMLGMVMSTAWAESTPEAKPTTAAQPTASSTSEPQPVIRVEDIDAPILE